VGVSAVVPARGGSTGIPGKNLALVAGVPLVTRAVNACLATPAVDIVAVTTDHGAIAAEADAAGAHVVRRPAEIAHDTATSESAVLHALDVLAAEGVDTDIAVLVQCTSPFLLPGDLDDAIGRVSRREADVVFSAVATHAFLWRQTEKGAEGVNHDHSFRPRRQDREQHYRETGAFYVMRAEGLRACGHRFFGRIEHHLVPVEHALEIDTEEDLALARAVAAVVDPPTPIDVDAVVTDFDGVHTDNRAFVDQSGRESVAVSRSDGMGIAMLLLAGIPVLALSTERNPVVTARASKLGMAVLQGVEDKAAALVEWITEHGFDPARVAYVGNDVNDLECLRTVGWPIVVPEAHPQARALARTVLSRPGGAGAVRDLCDRVLAARGSGSL
jgi:YrbI family 3-deoxy-D-manno-octulosonate 8-phosphate phosphatase